MIASRRTVLVGERLRQGISIDTAMELIASTAGDAAISLAVLDRPSGKRSVAISLESGLADAAASFEQIRNGLEPLFEEVSVVESPRGGLALEDRLT